MKARRNCLGWGNRGTRKVGVRKGRAERWSDVVNMYYLHVLQCDTAPC